MTLSATVVVVLRRTMLLLKSGFKTMPRLVLSSAITKRCYHVKPHTQGWVPSSGSCLSMGDQVIKFE